MAGNEMNRPLVLSAVEDIFFSAKIEAAARAAGVALMPAIDGHQLEAALHSRKPDLIILDLNSRTYAPLDVIRRIKADSSLAGIPLIGFLSHVQVELEEAARAAGCDQVMPRSAFSRDLPQILRPGRK